MGFIAPLYQLQSIYILPKSLVFVKLFLIRLATIDFFCAIQTCMTSENHCNCFRWVAQGNCLWGQAHWATLISRKLFFCVAHQVMRCILNSMRREGNQKQLLNTYLPNYSMLTLKNVKTRQIYGFSDSFLLS